MRKLSGWMLAVLLSTTAAQASVIFQDDFQSYGSQAGFQAAWPLVTADPMVLSTNNFHSPTQSVFSEGNLARRHYRDFGGDIIPTNANPLVAEFWMSVPDVHSNARQYSEIRGYPGAGFNQGGAVQELYAVGLFNGIANPNNKYQGRVAFGGPSWVNLESAPSRTPGWHKFSIEVLGGGVVNFYVDGIFGGSITDSSPNSLDDFILGSGLTSNPAAPQSSYYDDVRVEHVPEPASLMLVGLGALLLRRRR